MKLHVEITNMTNFHRRLSLSSASAQYQLPTTALSNSLTVQGLINTFTNLHEHMIGNSNNIILLSLENISQGPISKQCPVPPCNSESLLVSVLQLLVTWWNSWCTSNICQQHLLLSTQISVVTPRIKKISTLRLKFCNSFPGRISKIPSWEKTRRRAKI